MRVMKTTQGTLQEGKSKAPVSTDNWLPRHGSDRESTTCKAETAGLWWLSNSRAEPKAPTPRQYDGRMIPWIQELPSFRLFQTLSWEIFEILYAKGYLFEDPKPWNTSHGQGNFRGCYKFPWIEYQKRDRDTSSCCCKRNAKSSRSCSLSSYHQVVFHPANNI